MLITGMVRAAKVVTDGGVMVVVVVMVAVVISRGGIYHPRAVLGTVAPCKSGRGILTVGRPWPLTTRGCRPNC